MHRAGSILVTGSTVPLASGIAGDVYVVMTKIAGDAVGLASAGLVVLLLFGLWCAFPLIARWRGAGTAQYQGSASE